MAIYNEILSGRHNRFLQKLFSMKGRVPSPQLSSEIQVSHAIFSGMENRYLESWNTFGMATSFGASAANVNAFRLRNPLTSNVVAVLEQITVGNEDNASRLFWVVEVELSNTDLTTVDSTAVVPLDNRMKNTASVLQNSRTQAAVSNLGGLRFVYRPVAPPNTTIFLMQNDGEQIALLPGSAIQVTTNAVNLASSCAFRWRERGLEESERA